jgi:hypothetical protein
LRPTARPTIIIFCSRSSQKFILACSLLTLFPLCFSVSFSIPSYLCTPFFIGLIHTWHIFTLFHGLVSFLSTHTTHTLTLCISIGSPSRLSIRHYTHITIILRLDIHYGIPAYHPTHSFHKPHSLRCWSQLSPNLLSPRIVRWDERVPSLSLSLLRPAIYLPLNPSRITFGSPYIYPLGSFPSRSRLINLPFRSCLISPFWLFIACRLLQYWDYLMIQHLKMRIIGRFFDVLRTAQCVLDQMKSDVSLVR